MIFDGFLDQVIEMGMRLAGRVNCEDRRVQGQGLFERGNGEKMKIELPNMQMKNGVRTQDALEKGVLKDGSLFFLWCFVRSVSGSKLDFRGRLARRDMIWREMMFRFDWQCVGIWSRSAATGYYRAIKVSQK